MRPRGAPEQEQRVRPLSPNALSPCSVASALCQTAGNSLHGSDGFCPRLSHGWGRQLQVLRCSRLGISLPSHVAAFGRSAELGGLGGIQGGTEAF